MKPPAKKTGGFSCFLPVLVWYYFSMRTCLAILFVAVSAVGADLETWFPRESVVRHRRFAVAFDSARHCPRWVCWRIAPASNAVSRAGMRFRLDPLVVGSPSASAYSGTAYDRGHMCPADDMAADTDSMAETFLTSNCAPQDSSLNRGDWRELEAQLHGEAACSPVVCICGPIWLPGGRADRLGSIGVAVPDAFFKVAYGGTSAVSRAWFFPNKPGNRKPADYAVPVEAVERVTGLDFP